MSIRLLQVVPPWEYPGAEQRLLSILAGLPADVFEVSALLLGEQIDLARELSLQGVAIEHASDRMPIHVNAYRKLEQCIQSANADLIQLWSAPDFPFSWMIALRQDVPVIAVDTPAGFPVSGWRKAAKSLLINRTHSFVSTEWPGSGAKLSEPEWPYDSVPTGVEANESSPTENAKGQFRQYLGLPTEARLAAVINPFVHTAGIKDAIWSLDLLKCVRDDFHLLILGAGPQRWRLERFIRQTQTSDRVHFVKQITVRDLLPQVDFLWQTPHTVTDPYIVMLAMAHGVPVIATDLPHHRELVDDGRTGHLFAPGNRAHLARRTEALLKDEPLRQQMGATGREEILQRYSVSTMVKGYLDLYQSCLRRI